MQIDDGMRYHSTNLNVVESLSLDRLTVSSDKRHSHQFRELSAPVFLPPKLIDSFASSATYDKTNRAAGFIIFILSRYLPLNFSACFSLRYIYSSTPPESYIYRK